MPKDIKQEGNLPGKLFKIGDFAKRAGVTQRTVTHYMEKNLIIPEQLPERRGMLNKFSEQNLYEILLVRELVQHNFGLDDIRFLLNNQMRVFRADGKGSEILVIYDGHTEAGKIVLTTTEPDGSLKLSEFKNRKSVIVIDLTGLREKANELAK